MNLFKIYSTALVILAICLITDKSKAAYEVINGETPYPGYLYRPDVSSGETRPAILFLHGSEGGNGDFWKPTFLPPLPTGENTFTNQRAQYYASLGYVTLSLCYFDCRQLNGIEDEFKAPNELINVEIKSYVYEAYKWLKKNQWVKGKKAAIWGGSRGAELTLLVSSLTYQEKINIDAIIAESPSDFIASPFSKEDADLLSSGKTPNSIEDNTVAWTYENKPLPTYANILSEHYQGPSLITFWREDNIWGPLIDINRIIQRYKIQKIPHHHLVYDGEDNVQQDYLNFTKSLEKVDKLFIELIGTGHGAPMNAKQRALFFSTTNDFLKKSLDNQ